MQGFAANQTRFDFAVAGLDANLRVLGFDGTEAISRLFEFQLELACDKADIRFDSVMGMRALLTIEGRAGTRYINGVISRFEVSGENRRFTLYRASLVPFLWFFRHRQGSRIFQDQSVDQIITQVLTEAGVPADDFRFVLCGKHPVRDYCVQYRESELDYMRRLMEEEGIQFYFEHLEDRHTLVMADSGIVHLPIESPADIPYRPATGLLAEEEHVRTLRYAEEIMPGRVTLRSFDFRKPTRTLEVDAHESDSLTEDALEVYDFHGEYDKEAVGEFLARVRLEEHRTPGIEVGGEGDCTRFVPGYRFDLELHPRGDLNRTYLLTQVSHRGEQPQVLEETADNRPNGYSNSFEAVPADSEFRTPSVIRRPTVDGSQTAFVVGPAGEEIYVDKFGRVKVQFHWDREGRRDEHSSCWVRVSQTIAGASWGSMFIPRIGQEVIVDFLEGDPDRPIITGRVYNGQSMPPYHLPAQGVVSGIKSNTVKGKGYNEISFNDTAGKELFTTHAQFDMSAVVGHDRKEQVGNDQTVSIGNNRTESIGVNQSVSIGNNRMESVGANAIEQIAANANESVGVNKVIDVGANLAIRAGSSITLQCGASSISMTSGGIVTISGTLVSVLGAVNANVTAPFTTITGAAMLTTVGGVTAVLGGAILVKGYTISLN